MTTPVSVTKFEVRSHNSPDEVRTPNKTRVEVVQFDGVTMGQFNFEPGWRWSECIKASRQDRPLPSFPCRLCGFREPCCPHD